MRFAHTRTSRGTVSRCGAVERVALCTGRNWCAPRLVASTAEEITQVFDALIAGDVLRPDTLKQMLKLVPFPGRQDAQMVIHGGMGVYSDRASRYGRNYHHRGGGPG